TLSDRDRRAAWPVRDILVMEDDPAVAEMLHELAQRDGHTVEVAANGSEGLARLRYRRYRLLLLDLMMPVVDGHAVLQVLRADPAARRWTRPQSRDPVQIPPQPSGARGAGG